MDKYPPHYEAWVNYILSNPFLFKPMEKEPRVMKNGKPIKAGNRMEQLTAKKYQQALSHTTKDSRTIYHPFHPASFTLDFILRQSNIDCNGPWIHQYIKDQEQQQSKRSVIGITSWVFGLVLKEDEKKGRELFFIMNCRNRGELREMTFPSQGSTQFGLYPEQVRLIMGLAWDEKFINWNDLNSVVKYYMPQIFSLHLTNGNNHSSSTRTTSSTNNQTSEISLGLGSEQKKNQETNSYLQLLSPPSSPCPLTNVMAINRSNQTFTSNSSGSRQSSLSSPTINMVIQRSPLHLCSGRGNEISWSSRGKRSYLSSLQGGNGSIRSKHQCKISEFFNRNNSNSINSIQSWSSLSSSVSSMYRYNNGFNESLCTTSNQPQQQSEGQQFYGSNEWCISSGRIGNGIGSGIWGSQQIINNPTTSSGPCNESFILDSNEPLPSLFFNENDFLNILNNENNNNNNNEVSLL